MDEKTQYPIREELLQNLGYSEKSIRYIMDRYNLGPLASFTSMSSHVGGCGDLLQLYLDVDGDRIRGASFELTGCAGLQACASCLTEMIEGMTLDEAKRVEVEDIVASLGGLPKAKMDCAELARDTLRKALHELP